MLDFSYQVNNPLMKVTQAMMTNPFHDVMPEHKVIFLSLFTYGISLKTISNTLVGNMNIVSVVPLEHNGLLVYVHVLPNITTYLEDASDMIQQLCNLEHILPCNVHGGWGWGSYKGIPHFLIAC